MSALSPTLEAFFTERLIRQRNASPQTVASYRDTWRLLLGFASTRTGKQPSALDLGDLDVELISAFLDHLEHDRANSVSTRNTRLSAIHSLFRFAALRHPEHSASIQRVLAMPAKRTQRGLVTYLTESEADALLAATDRTTWTGRRDNALILVGLQTGLRISELIGLTRGDLHLGTGAHLSCHGKGRKDRVTPLTTSTVSVLRAWLAERGGNPDDPVFPTRPGKPLSRDAIERRIAVYSDRAAAFCPSIRNKSVTAHVLRHTCAMRLLEAGVDTTVIALWLGHEQVDTTALYLHADLTIKERAIAKAKPPAVPPGRYRATDALLAFLEAL
jgi:site-specific recombinase XerD